MQSEDQSISGETKHRSPWTRLSDLVDKEELLTTLRVLRSNKITIVGLVIAFGFILTAIFVWITNASLLPYNPYNIDPHLFLKPPSFSHPFGTDSLGRDVLSRIIAAAPIDAEVAFSVVGIAFLLGIGTGTIAGYAGGAVEEIVMRITDIFLAFPAVVLALAIVAALGPGILHTIFALVPIWWPSYTRLARGETLAMKNQQFVVASRAIGQQTRTIVLRHILPNILPVLLVYATLDIGTVIIVFSVLSYIGLGAQPPLPEWGLMAAQNELYLRSAPWTTIIPSLAILAVAAGFSLLGDGLRDALDPKIRGLFS
jgi:peptide/nickel transport system permease protein